MNRKSIVNSDCWNRSFFKVNPTWPCTEDDIIRIPSDSTAWVLSLPPVESNFRSPVSAIWPNGKLSKSLLNVPEAAAWADNTGSELSVIKPANAHAHVLTSTFFIDFIFPSLSIFSPAYSDALGIGGLLLWSYIAKRIIKKGNFNQAVFF